MWIVILLIVAVAVLLAVRVAMITRGHHRARPIDSGHPHLTDIDAPGMADEPPAPGDDRA